MFICNFHYFMQITDFDIILLKQFILSYIMLYVNVVNVRINAII